MTDSEKPIADDEWRTIVANVPLVSVDLVIEHDGGVLLGKRENEPVKGEWFVPGGTVFKNESRTEAVHRVAEAELGEPVVIDGCIGTYEHFYETAATGGVDSKHYLATAYSSHLDRNDPELNGDDQHGAFQVFRPPFDEFHPYIKRYLNDY
ncbi:hypothetical protein GCM10027435_02850 [Haloparvum alkalitolerans]|uniref:NUDIX domain-containing protein n=1 Tax=Haloparvum alkalitolerans TaxID=1042953 RepID=UPI003CF8A54C